VHLVIVSFTLLISGIDPPPTKLLFPVTFYSIVLELKAPSDIEHMGLYYGFHRYGTIPIIAFHSCTQNQKIHAGNTTKHVVAVNM